MGVHVIGNKFDIGSKVIAKYQLIQALMEGRNPFVIEGYVVEAVRCTPDGRYFYLFKGSGKGEFEDKLVSMKQRRGFLLDTLLDHLKIVMRGPFE